MDPSLTDGFVTVPFAMLNATSSPASGVSRHHGSSSSSSSSSSSMFSPNSCHFRAAPTNVGASPSVKAIHQRLTAAYDPRDLASVTSSPQRGAVSLASSGRPPLLLQRRVSGASVTHAAPPHHGAEHCGTPEGQLTSLLGRKRPREIEATKALVHVADAHSLLAKPPTESSVLTSENRQIVRSLHSEEVSTPPSAPYLYGKLKGVRAAQLVILNTMASRTNATSG